MATKDKKVEWGTKLEWASKRRFETKEFWGDHHYQQAAAELAAMQTIATIHHHCFTALNRELTA